MKFRTQFPIERISGHTGWIPGLVGYRSNGIDIFRRWVSPENPESPEQVAIRTVFTVCTQNFKNLTDAQRATWATWSQQVPVEVMERDITLQEMGIYVQSDVYSQIKTATHLTNAPTAPPGFAASGISNVAYASGTTTLSFDVAHNWTSGTDYWVVKITDTLASAQRNPRDTDWRLAEGVQSTSIVAVSATPQTISLSSPVFSWANNDYMGVSVQALSGEFAIGALLKWKGQITVT